MRGRVVQIGRLPGGGRHVAEARGSLHEAMYHAALHFTEHSGPGGFVGIAPIGRGFAVQLHSKDGRIEAWRIFRPVRREALP